MSKYTPGPWKWVKARTMRHLHSDAGYFGISQPIGKRSDTDEQHQADAQLIEAAPMLADLLNCSTFDALEDWSLRYQVELPDANYKDSYDFAKEAALRKAGL